MENPKAENKATTVGAFAVIDMLIPPNGGSGPPSHAAFQEPFYMMEGEVVAQTKKQTYTARIGDFACVPLGGVVHDFKNHADTIAHLLCVAVPTGLAAFFQEIGPEDQKWMSEIAAKRGQIV